MREALVGVGMFIVGRTCATVVGVLWLAWLLRDSFK